MPEAMPGLAAGSLLVYIPLMGDYITPVVLGGARGNMVGQMVAGQFESAQNWALGSAMAFVLMGFILATVLIVGVAVLLRPVDRQTGAADRPGEGAGMSAQAGVPGPR